ERGEIAQHDAGDEPRAVHVEDAEARRIGASGAAHVPSVARNDEPVARRVDQDPLRLRRVPVLAHPMVNELAWHEVRAEAASCSRWRPLLLQKSREHQAEVAAGRDDSTLGRARHAKSSPVERNNPRQHRGGGSKMRLLDALVGQLHVVQPLPVAMNQQALHNIAQRLDVAGQRANLCRMRSQLGHRSGMLVIFLRSYHEYQLPIWPTLMLYLRP